MSKAIVLTGITTTGTPHLGNYVGAIRPAIAASKDLNAQPFYFLADYHALIKCQEPERVRRSSLEIAATWLALGLDTNNAVFYRQSDVPEILELTWMLTCVTAKGLMNRSHAYKAAVADNEQGGEQDPDKGITMGLFSYPVLMAADILMFNANKVLLSAGIKSNTLKWLGILADVSTISTVNISRFQKLFSMRKAQPCWVLMAAK